MPICVIMIGPPASGKTTFCSEQFHGYTHLSTYDIVIDLYGTSPDGKPRGYDEALKNSNKETVIEVFNRKLAKAVERNDDIVIDRCNCTISGRKALIEHIAFKNKKYKFIAVNMEVPLSIALERTENNSGNVIPSGVIVKLYEKYQKPYIHEGYDAIYTIDEHGNIVHKEEK